MAAAARRESIPANILASGSVGSSIIIATNPLDCLKIRWQVLPRGERNVQLLQLARDIVRREGLWNGLWRHGLFSNVAAVFTCTGVRIGVYGSVRDTIMVMLNTKTKDAGTMASAGFLSGALSFFLATPFFQAKTRLQGEAGIVDPRTGLLVTGTRAGHTPAYRNLLHFVERCVVEEGPWALFRGSSALVVRGSLLSMGHLSGYDGTKTFCKERGLMTEGTPLHVGASLVGALLGTTFSCPADRVMTAFQTGPMLGRHYRNIGDCAMQILRREGPTGFMRGWLPFFLRIAPTFMSFGALYEQARRAMGMDYFD